MPSSKRECRIHPSDRPTDQRTPGQRDRDRILYSSAFRRLGGVTQVAAAGERTVFRNRLTHTLEVAQVARRLAENAISSQPELANALGGIDPDVVEAAALAHDLGHPPFGHIAETKLDDLVREYGNADGFEGNPQSFRIVAKLSLRHRRFPGLNLTRATLNAILKYPWFRSTGGGLRERKWGAYRSETKEFEWARELGPAGVKSPEAELMDFADDIAYSVHDLDDFFRVGLIPFDRILTDADARDEFMEKAFDRWRRDGRYGDLIDRAELAEAFKGLCNTLNHIFREFTQPYDDSREHRATLRSLTAFLINRYVTGSIKLRTPDEVGRRCVTIYREHSMEIRMLKELTWVYVINAPGLATQQHGQRRLIEDLFKILAEAAEESNFDMFPTRFSERMTEALDKVAGEERRREVARFVADYISGMTERQAIEIHSRLVGVSLGSVLDAP